MADTARARLVALASLAVLGSAGCVETSYWAIDTPDQIEELPAGRWEPVALRAIDVYAAWRNTSYYADARLGWRPPLFPELAEPGLFTRRAGSALGTRPIPTRADLPDADWYVRLLLRYDREADLGICLVLPCISIGRMKFELRVLAIPLEGRLQKDFERLAKVYICTMGQVPPESRCAYRPGFPKDPNFVYWEEDVALPEGHVQLRYERTIYRRARVFLPWNGLWHDERTGIRDTVDGAYARMVEDLLREVVRDLEAEGILVEVDLGEEPGGLGSGS